MDNYKYNGIELTPMIMKELMIEIMDGTQFRRKDAINKIIEYHKKNGGYANKSESSYISCFKIACRDLKNQGLVNCSYGTWRFNYKKRDIKIIEETKKETINYKVDEKIGKGNSSIYVYYYDIYKEYAILQGKEYFPCKIGRTEKDPLQRVLSQCSTCYPELPHIALIIYCKNSLKLENAIHSILKYNNRWIEQAPGTEWFMTNPEQIKNIYNNIEENK